MTKTILNALGHHNNVTKVAWGGGPVFIIVEVTSEYINVLNGPVRSCNLVCASTEIGAITAQENLNQEATFFHPKRLRFIGVIKVKKVPPIIDTTAFSLTLTGGSRKNEVGPAFSVNYFCGTTSTFRAVTFRVQEVALTPEDPPTWTNFGITYTNRRFNLLQEVNWSYSDPRGSSSGSTTSILNSVAGLALPESYDNPSAGNYSSGGSSQQAWYYDDDSIPHEVFPFMSCGDIPLAGDPQPSTFFEGFQGIRVLVIGGKGMKTLETIFWTFDTPVSEFVIPDPDRTGDFDGGRRSQTDIGKIKAGETPDHTQVFDDLPNGVYHFGLEKMTFSAIPPQPLPNGDPAPPNAKPYRQVLAWPQTLVQVKYTFTVQGPRPNYFDYTTPDTYEQQIPAGIHPPVDQTFM